MLNRVEPWQNIVPTLVVLVICTLGYLWFVPQEVLRLSIKFMCVSAMWLFLGWGIYIPSLLQDVKRQWEWDKKVLERILFNFLTQEIIDQELQRLAKELDSRCNMQINRQRAEDVVAEAEQLGEAISYAKGKFWKARLLAKDLGFVVKASYKDYLDYPVICDEVV